MKYLNKIKAGHTLKRSEIFFVIEELRTLDFGITIGTLGNLQYKAEYVYWPLIRSEPPYRPNSTPELDHIHHTHKATFEIETTNPEAAIQKLALKAMALLAVNVPA